jgi:OTT_1508-like deaminase
MASVPLVIYSTKKLCFLCSLFFSLCGKIDMPHTHGRLYEKWTLPAEIKKLKGVEAERVSVLLAAFQSALTGCISRAIMLGSKRISGPTISSESFALDLPPHISNFSIQLTPIPDHGHHKGQHISPNFEQARFEAEDYNPAQNRDEISLHVHSDDPINFRDSESAETARVATKALRLYFCSDEAGGQPSFSKERDMALECLCHFIHPGPDSNRIWFSNPEC